MAETVLNRIISSRIKKAEENNTFGGDTGNDADWNEQDGVNRLEDTIEERGVDVKAIEAALKSQGFSKRISGEVSENDRDVITYEKQNDGSYVEVIINIYTT